ncbi:MAG TPA: MmgE/PrpD family protein [Burkholderiales bacterium]|nr:MmgE/PrpD family protein [Burkholderiales bacterium]
MAYVVERLASWAVESRSRPFPPEAIYHAKRAVIDWHAAYTPGSVVAPATLLGKAFPGERDLPRTRALIMGSAAHTEELDDIFRDGIYHPGAPTISAALAVAPSVGLSGMSFLRAVVVGYEISTRIGAAMGRAHYKYWHNTGTIGVFGACAAVAEILGLDKRSFSHALATVTTFAAALQQAFRMDSMSKPLHAGRAAEAGVTAAFAAREGVTGSLDVIEGEAGFGRAMSDGPDWDKALATLGEDWHITRMTFKNHACCGHTFAAIDGALALKERMKIAAEDIARVRVGTYRAGVEVAHYEKPRTPAEGRFSLKYVVATALTHGSVRLSAFQHERLSDSKTIRLMEKISTGIDPELDATFPRQRAARVAIETKNGKREELLQPTRKGDPDLPLSDRELEEKYTELVAPVLGAEKAQNLLQSLWRLESLPQLP